MVDGTLHVRRRQLKAEAPLESDPFNIGRPKAKQASELGLNLQLDSDVSVVSTPTEAGDEKGAKHKPQGIVAASMKMKIRTGTQRYFMRGQHYAPMVEDYKVAEERKQRLQPYDTMLKKFRYHDALDAALEVCRVCLIFCWACCYNGYAADEAFCGGGECAGRACAAVWAAHRPVQSQRRAPRARAALSAQTAHQPTLLHAAH